MRNVQRGMRNTWGEVREPYRVLSSPEAFRIPNSAFRVGRRVGGWHVP